MPEPEKPVFDFAMLDALRGIQAAAAAIAPATGYIAAALKAAATERKDA